MHCTESRHRTTGILRLAVTALLLMTFSACSSLRSVTNTVPKDPDSQQLRTENPYLANAKRAPKEVSAAMAQAHQSFIGGDSASAETQLVQITERWPKLSGPWLNLGIVQQKARQAEAAENSFRQAIKVNDNNVFAWNQLAALLRDLGRFDEAEQSYLEALERWPDYSDAHRNLGILYDLYLNRPGDALQQFRLAQSSREEPDKLLDGWILELERRT
ncbi:tetratricopeptide repeat protein [Microbulbifer epialgicus]|uniref:Tetratricopeptide repeat protein n=1 Tax=Microbulbifer epialgicus TaxID=393907 RepID=A0ABV4NVY4_9GAMM